MKTAVFQDAYAELVKLAVERRARLEESRKLWQFYWDMADEENWIKEKEHIIEGSCFLSRSSSLKSKCMLVHVNIVHEGRSSRQSKPGCEFSF